MTSEFKLRKNDPAHVLYTCEDKDAPKNIKDSNGDIALGLCKICRKGEVELEEPCISSTDIVPSSGCVFNDLGIEKPASLVADNLTWIKRYNLSLSYYSGQYSHNFEVSPDGSYCMYSEVAEVVASITKIGEQIADKIFRDHTTQLLLKEDAIKRAESAEAKVGKAKTILQNLIQACEGEVEEVFAGEIGDQLEEARAFLNAPADGQ